MMSAWLVAKLDECPRNVVHQKMTPAIALELGFTRLAGTSNRSNSKDRQHRMVCGLWESAGEMGLFRWSIAKGRKDRNRYDLWRSLIS
jgi:hypothetical protein